MSRLGLPDKRWLAPTVGAMALALSGCQSKQDAPRPAPDPKACTHIGQTCEFSPNKLGSCVQRDNCTEDCLVCQSQH